MSRADVVVRAALDQVRLHRQDRRGPVQCLDLRLLIHTQHHGVLGRVQVQADDVDDLGLQHRVGGEPERLAAPGLDAVLTPDRRHRVVGDLQMPGQQSRGPVRDGVLLRRWRQRHGDHLRPVDHPRPARPLFIRQTSDSLGLIPVSPFDHPGPGHPDLHPDRRVPNPLRGQQHHPSPLHQPRRRTRGPRQPQQPVLITFTQHQSRSRTIRHTRLSRATNRSTTNHAEH
jgi:hypothetical protein